MTQCVIDPPRRDSYWLRPLGGRHRYHPAKGSFARFPSGASLNATMQFTLLPSELGQNLSFSGANYIVQHSTVSQISDMAFSGTGRESQGVVVRGRKAAGKRSESLRLRQTEDKGASCALSSCLGLGYIRRCMRPSPSHLQEHTLRPSSRFGS